MNAAPVIQTSVQPTVGPTAAAGTDNTANARGAPSAFAGVLNAAGVKPGRRAGASKQPDDNASGGSLPPAGNQSPPPPLPQAAASPVATSHPKGGSAADRARVERGRASGSAPGENPLAVQAAAADAAALIDGTKSLSGSPIGAADRNAAAAGPGGAIKNAAAFGAMSGKPQMDAGIESGPAAKVAAPAVEATAVVASNAAAAANAAAAINTSAAAANTAAAAKTVAAAAANITAAANIAAAADAAVAANVVAAANTAAAVNTTAAAANTAAPVNTTAAAANTAAAINTAAAAASTAASAKTEAPPPLESNSGLTSNSPATPDPAVPAATTANATPTAASGAAGKAAEKPHLTALHPVSKATGGTAAPATDSGTVPAGGSKADAGSSQASASSSDLATASGGINAQAPAADTGAQDAAVTSAAAAAAMAGTPQPANTGKATSENSYDSDASASAPGAGAETAPAAASASASAGRSGTRAAAALAAAQDAANAPMAVDAGKHTHAGFDLAALADNAGGAAAGLSQLNANASVGVPADAAPAAALRIHASVDSADFTQGLSDRVSWMVDNGVNGAKLQVNPPQLGPIELRISVQGDHAQVWMTTHSAVARDALESSSPKLREMLNAQGFGQVSVDISQRSFQDRSAYTPPYQRESAGDRSTAATPAAATTGASMTAGSTPRTLLGALDAYA